MLSCSWLKIQIMQSFTLLHYQGKKLSVTVLDNSALKYHDRYFTVPFMGRITCADGNTQCINLDPNRMLCKRSHSSRHIVD